MNSADNLIKSKSLVSWQSISGDLCFKKTEKIFVYSIENCHLQITEGICVELICFLNKPADASQIKVDLLAPNSQIKVICLTELKDKEVLQQAWQINHLAVKTESSLDFKTLLNDQSTHEVKMNIEIQEGQKGSSTDFKHQAIQLSKQAKIISIPGLTISEKDVQASHSVGIGQLDEDKIFYLESRGFSRDEARNLILEAFLAKFWENIMPNNEFS